VILFIMHVMNAMVVSIMNMIVHDICGISNDDDV